MITVNPPSSIKIEKNPLTGAADKTWHSHNLLASSAQRPVIIKEPPVAAQIPRASKSNQVAVEKKGRPCF